MPEGIAEVVGVVPAAGYARRLTNLPFSKELYPVAFGEDPEHPGAGRPRAICEYLLEAMRDGGITRAYVVLREGKWDVPAYLKDGSWLGMRLAYLMVGLPFGVPYTVDQAYAWVARAVVGFGFPDIFFQAPDGFTRLRGHYGQSNADLVLGLFPTPAPHAVDMVGIDAEGRVVAFEQRPRQTGLAQTWNLALWSPTFTEFLHDYVQADAVRAAEGHELSMGQVIQAAIRRGMRCDGVVLASDACVDIGTPETLAATVRRLVPRDQ